MASSGRVNTNAYDGRYVAFIWNVTSQNIKANTSTISWRLEGDGTGGSASWYKAGANPVYRLAGTVVTY